MRELERNKITIYYANFIGSEPILDEQGYETGEYKQKYTEPTPLEINVSAASGENVTRQFGDTVDYDRTLVTCNTSLPINEQTRLWVDQKDLKQPHDYDVKKIAKSLNSVLIAVKKVEVSAGA